MPAITLLLAGVAVAQDACTPEYGDCFNSTCCRRANFGCMKSRVHRTYAQCRPLPTSGCVAERDWECPGWDKCASAFKECTASKCCKDAGFGCFRRPKNLYAQCMPIADGTKCTDTETWLCPGWELCGATREPCTHTHCCADKRDTCYQKHGAYAQCLRTGTCEKGPASDCIELQVRAGGGGGGERDGRQTRGERAAQAHDLLRLCHQLLRIPFPSDCHLPRSPNSDSVPARTETAISQHAVSNPRTTASSNLTGTGNACRLATSMSSGTTGSAVSVSCRVKR
jgi:hypothetical protein